MAPTAPSRSPEDPTPLAKPSRSPEDPTPLAKPSPSAVSDRENAWRCHRCHSWTPPFVGGIQIFGTARHHCRGCGRTVCQGCSALGPEERLCSACIRPAKKRRIYLIRHAESTWNVPVEELKEGYKEAQASDCDWSRCAEKTARGGLDLSTKLLEKDHPISQRGREQAETLRLALANEELKDLCNIDVVLSSPMLRALMTAGLVFPHSTVILDPDAREAKNCIWQRDCVGVSVGADIVARARKNGLPSTVTVRVPRACSDVWWSGDLQVESERDVEERGARLWRTLVNWGFENEWRTPLVCITHSNLIRAICRTLSCSTFTECEEPGADEWEVYGTKINSSSITNLKRKRISNCGVVRVTLAEGPIVDDAEWVDCGNYSSACLHATPSCGAVELLCGTFLD